LKNVETYKIEEVFRTIHDELNDLDRSLQLPNRKLKLWYRVSVHPFFLRLGLS